MIRYAEKMGGAPNSDLSQMNDEVLAGLPELPIPVLEETRFDSGSARNLIKRSLVEEFPDFMESTDHVIKIETAAGPGTCSEII